MVITIDTSALLAVLLNERHKSAIVEATEGHELQAPSILDAEVGNALSAMFNRDRLSFENAQKVISQFEEIPIRRTKVRLNQACKLAYDHNLYAYDAYFLDCAKQYRTPLLTIDDSLIATGKKVNINMIEV